MQLLRNYIILLSVSVLLLFIGCNSDHLMNSSFGKNEEQPNWNPIRELAFKPETDGILQVIAYRNQTGNNAPVQYHCGGMMYQHFDERSFAVDGGKMKIGHTSLTADPSREYRYGLNGKCDCEGLFGKMVNFELGGMESSLMHSTGFIDSLYLPKEIYLLSPEGGAKISLSKGVTVKWNADDKNSKEVMLINLEATEDATKTTEKIEDEAIKNYINTADKGSYTLTTEHFKGLTAGSKVRLRLIRGNYDVVVSDDFTTYSICGFSYVEDTFELVE